MHKILLKFKSIKAKPDLNTGDIKIILQYNENDAQRTIEKVLLPGDSIDRFAAGLIKSARDSAKNNFKPCSNNLLESFVTIIIDEREIGETEERIIDGLKKLRDKLRGFKSIKTSDNYMNRFFDVSKLEIKL